MGMFSRDSVDHTIEDCSVKGIVNYNEIIAIKMIREILGDNTSFCRCATCIEELFSLTMNALPPRYTQVTSDKKHTCINNFFDGVMVRHTVMEALEKVSESPHH